MHETRRIGRRWGVLPRLTSFTATVACVVLLAACSAGSTDAQGGGSLNAPDGEVAANSQAAGTPSSDDTPLREAGSLTIAPTDGSPVSYTLTLSVPDPSVLPQTAPDDVLDACHANYAVVRATLLPMHAKLKIEYNGGSLPQIVTLVPNELLGSARGGSIGSLVVPDQGSWACQDPINLNISAGQPLDLSVWLLPQTLSNAHPTPDQAVLDNLQLMPSGFGGGGLTYVTHNTSAGPGGFCSGHLFLYATAGDCNNGY